MAAPYATRHMRKFIKSSRLPSQKKPPIIDFQDEIVEMYLAPVGVVEGVEKRGRRYIKWAFKSRLGKSQTPSVMAKPRQNINSAFYLRYSYAYVSVNVETNLKMAYYKLQKESPWITKFEEEEKWLNDQKSNGLNIDNIQWPNTKWVFVKFQTLKSRPWLIINHCWARGRCQTGCATLHTGAKW